MRTKRQFLGLLASAPLLSAGLPVLKGSMAHAAAPQPTSSRNLRWLIPYPAGGGSDFMARVVAHPMTLQTGQNVIVDNKPGGNGAIAVADLLRAPADGHAMINVDNGTLVFNPALYRKLGYSPSKDLRLVTLLARAPMILVVGPGSKAQTAQEYIATIRAQPGRFSFGSAGAGTPQHMAMEMLKKQAGLDMLHIPYRGSAPALGDLAGGQIPAVMSDFAAASSFLQSGKLRALAVADTQRHPMLPDVPTFEELGLSNVEATALVSVAVHASTPDAFVHALQQRIAQALQHPETQEKYRQVGLQTVGNTPEAFTQMIQNETTRWHALIAELGINLD